MPLLGHVDLVEAILVADPQLLTRMRSRSGVRRVTTGRVS